MRRLETRLGKRFLRSRGEHSPEGDHNSNWAISYGDMITLLLTFFILFFSVDRGKKDVVMLGKIVNEEFNGLHDPKADLTWGVRAPQSEASATYAGIQEKMVESLNTKTTVIGNKLVVEFPKVSFFKSLDYRLTQEGQEALAKFANVFGRFSGRMRLIVRGYTDNRPVRTRGASKFDDNLELSALRAISALRLLASYGIPFELMRIGGYGEADKGRQISSADRLALDRKIVLVVEPLDQTERGIAPDDWTRIPPAEDPKGKGVK